MCVVSPSMLRSATEPPATMNLHVRGTVAAGRPKPAAWGSIPVALSLLVMLARRHHRLQPHHYTS